MRSSSGGTRSALLDAALDAFASHGFAGASIRAITRAVGVRESAFYAHFTSKRAAYDELFGEAGPPVAARALDSLPEDLGPGEFLPRFAAMIIDVWSEPRARKIGALLMRDAFDGEAQGWRTLQAAISGVRALLLVRFERWQKTGRAQPGLPAETLVFEFIATITMARFLYFNIASSDRESAAGRRLIQSHAETFAALISTPSTDGKPG